MMTRSLVILFTFLWLTSCATVAPQETTAQNQTLPWDSRVKTLSDISQWDLKGMISIRSAHDAGSATLEWQQKDQNYHISMLGPLGTGSFELNGQPGNVELAFADGKHFHAQSPEDILAQQTGWQLPVSNLNYWIRGLPVPNSSANKNFDSYHHLTSLQQDGWNIQFLRYTSVHGIDVPSKIFLNHEPLTVKIVISHWSF